MRFSLSPICRSRLAFNLPARYSLLASTGFSVRNGCEKHINYALQLIQLESLAFLLASCFNFKANSPTRGRCKMCKQPFTELKCKYLLKLNGYLRGSTVAPRLDLHKKSPKERKTSNLILRASFSDFWYLNCTSCLLFLLLLIPDDSVAKSTEQIFFFYSTVRQPRERKIGSEAS